MHVLHIIDSLGLGGAERMLVDIANATVRTGDRVSVCVTRGEVALAAQLDPRIELLVLGRQRRVDDVAAAVRLARWIRAHGVEVLHVHMRSSLKYVLLLRALRAIRVPVVFHDHYGSIEIDPSIPRWFRAGHRFIAQYVGVHEKLRAWAEAGGMPRAQTTTIENCIDLSRLTSARTVDLRAELGIAAAVPLGLLVASFKREKGIDLMIEAVALARHRRQLRIAVAGGGLDSAYARECKALVRAHGLDDVITFLGARPDIAGILPSVDFALLSSHSESGPLVLIEYLAAARPIVATRVGDIGRRLAQCGIPGFVPAGSAADFARALDELLDLSADQRQRRGERGRQVLAEGWDIRDAISRWRAVYRAALSAA